MMASVVLVSINNQYLPVVAEKTSAGAVGRKGLEYYLIDWPLRRGVADLCDHLLRAARDYPSVLEHVVLTFYIDGCSRACSHQLVRHRLASYTQESQRYSVYECPWEDLARALHSLEEALREKAETWTYERLSEAVRSAVGVAEKCLVIPDTVLYSPDIAAVYLRSALDALIAYRRLVTEGVPAEDARYVLPQSVKTRLLMTLNLRELLHIAKLRTTRHAQWEIRGVVEAMIDEAKREIPCIQALIDAYS